MEHFDSPALRRLLELFPSAVQATHADLGDATAQVERGSLLEIMRLLRDEPGLDFEMLTRRDGGRLARARSRASSSSTTSTR